MRVPRIYHASPLAGEREIVLDEAAAHHVGRVLRMQVGQWLALFDGSNWRFDGQICRMDKGQVAVRLHEGALEDRESPLHVHIGQVISRGEKMEFTIQKAIELGVNEITPLFSERCGVKLDALRLEKKIQQWRKIAIAACEQCGRNRLARVHPALSLAQWCAGGESAARLNLNPASGVRISQLARPLKRVRLLIGPEGGLSPAEIALAAQWQFTDVMLGPRVLRTETTALTAIAALQVCFGDLG